MVAKWLYVLHEPHSTSRMMFCFTSWYLWLWSNEFGPWLTPFFVNCVGKTGEGHGRPVCHNRCFFGFLADRLQPSAPQSRPSKEVLILTVSMNGPWVRHRVWGRRFPVFCSTNPMVFRKNHWFWNGIVQSYGVSTWIFQQLVLKWNSTISCIHQHHRFASAVGFHALPAAKDVSTMCLRLSTHWSTSPCRSPPGRGEVRG